MTVYVICEPRSRRDDLVTYDITPAEEFGEIVYVFPQFGNPPAVNYSAAAAHAYNALCDFDCEADYIVWAGGDTVVCVIVGGVIADLTGGRYNQLRWERNKERDGGRYVPVAIDLGWEIEDD